MKRKEFTVVVLLLVFALVLAGCGGGQIEPTPTPEPTMSATVEVKEQTPEAEATEVVIFEDSSSSWEFVDPQSFLEMDFGESYWVVRAEVTYWNSSGVYVDHVHIEAFYGPCYISDMLGNLLIEPGAYDIEVFRTDDLYEVDSMFAQMTSESELTSLADSGFQVTTMSVRGTYNVSVFNNLTLLDVDLGWQYPEYPDGEIWSVSSGNGKTQRYVVVENADLDTLPVNHGYQYVYISVMEDGISGLSSEDHVFLEIGQGLRRPPYAYAAWQGDTGNVDVYIFRYQETFDLWDSREKEPFWPYIDDLNHY